MRFPRPPKTPEARAVAAFMDTLNEETRQYLHGMVYRVAGVEPPSPPKRKGPPRVTRRQITTIHDDLAKVIDLAQRRAGGAP